MSSLGLAALGRAWGHLPSWTKRSDFALVLLAGALLRLLWLDSTSFLGDQAQLLALARLALDSAALPLTGIRSSLGTMNPPASIYLLLPFALLDPFWAVLASALANVGAVVLLYRIADRYVGRGTAFAAGLLYATAWGPVWYSRFLWQQNLLAPVLLLFFWTLCRGVIEGRRGWLGWNLALWGIAVQLHPTAAPLLLLTAVSMGLARATLRWRDLPAGALALGVLFLPSALWELQTHWGDVALLRASASGAAHTDGTAIQHLLALLEPASRDSLGQGSLYANVYAPLGVLAALMALLAAVSTLWLLMVVLRPLVPPRLLAVVSQWASRIAPGRRAAPTHASTPSMSAGGRSQNAPTELRRWFAVVLDDSRWRFRLLLALWELAPLALMLRHSAPVFPHYVLVVLPAAFLIAGVFLAWAARRLAALRPIRARMASRPTVPTSIRGSQLLAAGILVLALVQAFGTAAWELTIARGAFDATEHGARYGLPLDTQRAALFAANRAAHSQGAELAVATSPLYQESLEYLAATEVPPASVYDADACLVVPSTGSRPLVTLAIDPGAAGELLPRLQGVKPLAGPATRAGISSSLVRLPPGATLPGERSLLASTTPQGGPRLASYLMDRSGGGDAQLLLHWTGTPRLPGDPSGASHVFDGVAPASGSPPVAHYWFLAQPLDPSGNALGAALWAQCPQLAWGAGHDVYSSVAIPAPLATNAAAWRVSAFGTPYLASRPSLGPVSFVAGDVHEVVGVPVAPEVVIPAQ